MNQMTNNDIHIRQSEQARQARLFIDVILAGNVFHLKISESKQAK